MPSKRIIAGAGLAIVALVVAVLALGAAVFAALRPRARARP